MKRIFIFNLFMAIALFAMGCSDDDTTNDQKSFVKISLTDAPGDFNAVYVDVQNVVVKYNGSEEEVFIGEINTGVYDLLLLTGGISVLLVDGEVPPGNISQIRLILGTENSVVVDGVTFPLATPSAQQSGLKIQVNETLLDGMTYEFMLDFDVEESIVQQGNGNYLLKPVLRAGLVAESGTIIGSILPINFQALVTATNSNNSISAYTSAQGQFALQAVPDGIYTVVIEPELVSGLENVTITDVQVSAGVVTDLGIIQLE